MRFVKRSKKRECRSSFPNSGIFYTTQKLTCSQANVHLLELLIPIVIQIIFFGTRIKRKCKYFLRMHFIQKIYSCQS